MYYSYRLYFRMSSDLPWQFLTFGRVKAKTYIQYERYLTELRRVLNKNSLYMFKVVSCYEKFKDIQLECPF